MKSIILKIHFLLVFAALSLNLSAQQLNEGYTIIQYPAVPAEYSPLHKKVGETSGLIYYEKHIWTFNDSGGKPEIYKIDKETGKIIRTVILENAENHDWEDITQDEKYIYIGDFGNNKGNRTDLKIYKISKKQIASKKNRIKVTAEILEFSYNDQTSYEIRNRNNDFDCESMVSFGDSLIIFTKNWVNGQTRMYKLPKTPGRYELDKVSSFNIDGLATGADFNKDNNVLLIIGYKDRIPFIWYFYNFNGNKPGSNKVYRIELVRMKNSQTEGITWLNNETIAFSTEKTETYDQAVFQLNIQQVLKLIND